MPSRSFVHDLAGVRRRGLWRLRDAPWARNNNDWRGRLLMDRAAPCASRRRPFDTRAAGAGGSACPSRIRSPSAPRGTPTSAAGAARRRPHSGVPPRPNARRFAVSCGMGSLWIDAQAPSWLPLALDAKYASASSSLTTPDRAFDAHLRSRNGLPVKAQCRSLGLQQVASLSAVMIRVKDEAALVDVLQSRTTSAHLARRVRRPWRGANAVGSGQRSRAAYPLRFFEEREESRDRIAGPGLASVIRSRALKKLRSAQRPEELPRITSSATPTIRRGACAGSPA